MKLNYLPFLITLFISCNQKKSDLHLQLEPIHTSCVELGRPMLIKELNSQLFVDQSFSGDYFIDVIDAKQDSILYSFAKKGNGPNEFLQITSMDLFHDKGNDCIMLFDNMLKKIAIYSIDSLNLYKDKCQPLSENKINEENRFLEIYKLSNKYIATGRTKKKFTLLDDKLNSISSCIDYFTNSNTKDDYMTLSKANYGRLSISPNREYIASVVFMSGTISIYNVESDSVKNRWNHTTSNFKYLLNGNNMVQKSPTGDLAADFMGTEIWGLYSGEEKKNGTNFAKQFHKFNSNGKLLQTFYVNSPLFNFCISQKDSLIYAISYDGDPKIVTYKVP